MRLRQLPKTPELRFGDYVTPTEACTDTREDITTLLENKLGKPPYIVVDMAGVGDDWRMVIVRSSHSKHPFSVKTARTLPDNFGRVRETNLMSGVVSVPRQFVERTLPPTPELATGRTVKLNVAELQKCNLPQAQFLALTGKYANKVCKVLRIIELQDAQDPLGRKYYAMVGLKDSLEKDSPHSIPVEALETVQ